MFNTDHSIVRRVFWILGACLLFVLAWTGQSALGAVTEDVAPDFVVISGPTTGVIGSPVQLQAVVTPTTTTLPLEFEWHADDLPVQEHTVSSLSDVATFTWTTAGVKDVHVQVSNAAGTVNDIVEITITEIPITGLTAGNDGPVMIGEVIGFSASIVTGSNVTYLWNFGDGDIAAGAVVTHTYATAGTWVATVTASNSVGSQLVTTNAIVNQPTVSVDAVTLYVDEGVGAAQVGVVLDQTCGVPVSVIFTSSNASALVGEDYVLAVGELTIPAGEFSASVPVSITDDLVDEPDESFRLSLSSPTNANLGLMFTTVVWIQDNDAAPSAIINDVSIIEGNSGTIQLTFTISMSAPSGRVVRFNYGTASITALEGSDFTATSGVLSLMEGDTSIQAQIPVIGDYLVEPNETFKVQLTNPFNATLADDTGIGTILNDDTKPLLSFSNTSYISLESADTAKAILVLNHTYPEAVTVKYTTSNGTALSALDYEATSEVVTIDAGSTQVVIRIPLISDLLAEGDETLHIGLSNLSTNASYGAITSAILTIKDTTAFYYLPVVAKMP